jgi:hypothetical protein
VLVTYSLKWPDPRTLSDLDSFDTSASNSEVLIWGCNGVDHYDVFDSNVFVLGIKVLKEIAKIQECGMS